MVSIQSLTKSYDSKKVVNDFSLSIQKGKAVSLIGPSGCGKSTLLRMVMGLIPKDSGSVHISGEELTTTNVLELRRKMGYVIQKGGLFPHLSVRQNCSLVTGYLGWDEAKTNTRIEEMAALTKINPTMLNRLPGELSGGQQQRIGLIRALMLDPEILLLDEPLGSIDPLVRYELQTDLREIFTALNKTVLLVTHDLGEAAYLGDSIVLMKEGRIEQEGSIQEILKKPANEFVEQFITAQRSPLSEIEL
ncbi:MAG: ABC transporter ATP-binding protein [Balneolaceae bacterium]